MLRPPGALRWPNALPASETTQYPNDWDLGAPLGGRGVPGLAQVQAFSPQAWHCQAPSSSPLGSENKDLSKQADPYPTHPLGERSRGHWGGLDDQGGTLAGHTQTLCHRVNRFFSALTPTSLARLPGLLATPAILLETRSLTPALQGAFWQRLHRTLAALHTPHTTHC